MNTIQKQIMISNVSRFLLLVTFIFVISYMTISGMKINSAELAKQEVENETVMLSK